MAGEQGFFRLDLIRVKVGAVRPLRGNPHPERRIPYSPNLIAVSFIEARWQQSRKRGAAFPRSVRDPSEGV